MNNNKIVLLNKIARGPLYKVGSMATGFHNSFNSILPQFLRQVVLNHNLHTRLLLQGWAGGNGGYAGGVWAGGSAGYKNWAGGASYSI